MDLTNFKPQLVSTGDPSLFIYKNDVAIIEPKIDGIRIILEKRGNKIKLYSRTLRDWTNHFKKIIPSLRKGIKYDNCILDGEIAVMKDKHFTSSNSVLKKKLKKDERFVYFLFDIIKAGKDDLREIDLKSRKEYLIARIIPNTNMIIIPFTYINNDEDLEIVFRRVIEKGGEGVVLKNLQPYGQDTYNWLKKKPFDTLDLLITNKKQRTDKKGWMYELSDKSQKVGSVFSAQDLKIGQVVEISYEKKYEKKGGYSLRFPKIMRLREDK